MNCLTASGSEKTTTTINIMMNPMIPPSIAEKSSLYHIRGTSSVSNNVKAAKIHLFPL